MTGAPTRRDAETMPAAASSAPAANTEVPSPHQELLDAIERVFDEVQALRGEVRSLHTELEGVRLLFANGMPNVAHTGEHHADSAAKDITAIRRRVDKLEQLVGEAAE